MTDVIRVHRDIIGREFKVGSVIAGLSYGGIYVGKVDKINLDKFTIRIITANNAKIEVSSVNVVLIDSQEYFYYMLTKKTK